MRDAVFPGGHRIRPRLAFAVAQAMPPAGVDPDLVLRAASALELVHCASLVHDDLPCFDDALLRRGLPSIHAAHGEHTAVLVGDALFMLAFEHLAAPCDYPDRALRISRRLGLAIGSRSGIVGGQALESEIVPTEHDQVRDYHDLKTGPLFRLATEVGALAGGISDPEEWGFIGHWIGAAFQLADDLYDRSSAVVAGKATGRDAALGRPNAAQLLGETVALAELREFLGRARAQAHALTRTPRPILAIVDEVEHAFEERSSL